jgi:hypothetical protein
MSDVKRKVKVLENLHRDGAWRMTVKCESAIFHGFGFDYEEFEDGPGNFSAAIVEYPDGSVGLVRADRIQFIDTEISA